MALSAKLELRQGQTLVMTPQLQQAIKLLQLSNLELGEFVDAELERNPLLEREEAPEDLAEPRSAEAREAAADSSPDDGADEWLDSGAAASDPAAALDTDYSNVDPEATAGDMAGIRDSGWSTARISAGSFDDEDSNLEAYLAAEVTLHDHLNQQLSHLALDPIHRFVAVNLIDMVDEAGYLRGDLDELARRLGAPLELAHQTLARLQKFEPAGVFARNLAECLTLQLKERNRFDPVIGRLIAHLDLLASHNLTALRRVCGTDHAELTEMIGEIRTLDPKPGLKFGTAPVQAVVPDVIVRQRMDGGWHVELNSETLPRVLVNQSYFTQVSRNARSPQDKGYLSECLQTANWLVKSLDQRARTILRVAEEIVRQQDGFFAYGIQHLRPLNLRTVADAISMHESTVSRVTSNKYMATNRGIFELKYFFTSSIASAGEGEAHSSEAVRHRIKQLIDAETSDEILSDDRLVAMLKDEGIDIARRTVAKYREGMQIASSVQRRREKRMQRRMTAYA